MSALSESFLTRLARAIDSTSSESDVSHKVIAPLLKILGYQDLDWRTQVVVGQIKLDFLVHPKEAAIAHPPYLVIEVKAPSQNITKNVWQINNYLRRSGAVFGLLTNGRLFRVFYHYNKQIATIAVFDLKNTTNHQLLYQILCKQTSLKFTSSLHQSQLLIYNKFANYLRQIFAASADESQTLSILRKLENIRTNSNRVREECKSMIITVFNNKGGVGKTTTTINLAAALNQIGKRILLIDIDPQANLTIGLGIDPLKDIEEQSKKDICNLLTEPKTTLENVVISKQWNKIKLDIVPSHIRLSEMEQTLINTVDVDRILEKKIKPYRDRYDYILIDPPPSFGKVNAIAMMASSAILVPTQLAPYPIRALEYVVNRAIGINEIRDESMSILGIAVSMYSRRAGRVALSMAEKVQEVLGKNPASKNVELWPEKTWIPSLSVVATTTNKGYPLCEAEFDKDLNAQEKEAAQDACDCYTNLAEYLISVTSEAGK
jgi:cellulose biosynthesis protein BcsQ/predicted type IV restriction endonuclease